MPLSRTAVEVGVIGAVGEFLIFNHFMPPVIDVRSNQPHDREIEKSERTGLIVGTAFLALLVSFSPGRIETFAIAGGALIALDYAYKHANAVHPASGTMQRDMGAEQSLYTLPDYSADVSEEGVG
jgi:hypothetical protein